MKQTIEQYYQEMYGDKWQEELDFDNDRCEVCGHDSADDRCKNCNKGLCCKCGITKGSKRSSISHDYFVYCDECDTAAQAISVLTGEKDIGLDGKLLVSDGPGVPTWSFGINAFEDDCEYLDYEKEYFEPWDWDEDSTLKEDGNIIIQ